ncbi:TlpA family protein disulfide reductase [Carboxylicivirga caseinilyticus]|uniref:TlpA family protein disulfide reductase n=1 Tax=Carboxylicivirga caseinilyticus TaxID=3417572 RepID=UPI003D351489|nr:redoxin family protein [Marinilabiliaceae bacterium A049]
MKFVYFILFILALASCNTNNTVKITGTITNPDGDVITLNVPFKTSRDTIATIQEDGTFKAELEITKPYMATIINGDAFVKLNLVPGSVLNISFDGTELKSGKTENVTIEGEGSESSILLLELRNIQPEENIKALLAYPAPEFDSKVTSHIQTITDKIDEFESSNPGYESLTEILRLEQKVALAQYYNYFVMYHARFAPNDTLPVPEEFKTFVDAIATDNYDAFELSRQYKGFVVDQTMSAIDDKLTQDGVAEGSIAYTSKLFDAVVAMEVPQIVKDEMGNRMLGSYTYEPDSIKEVMKTRYTEIIKNEEYTNEFKALLAKLEKLQPGAVAPTFAYNDINGNQVTSEDLKGKVIYIDVWATWCGPCKGEIPYLKAMEEELHDSDIAFVSISVDNDKSAWEKMVADKELRGYQLFAPNAWDSEIIQNYAIRGIPRFIMIDKEGKLVNANATRPSNPETKDKLIELANS